MASSPNENAEPSNPTSTAHPEPSPENTAAVDPKKTDELKQDAPVKNGDDAAPEPMDTSSPAKRDDSPKNAPADSAMAADASTAPNEEAKSDVKPPEEASSNQDDGHKMQDYAKDLPAAPTAAPEALSTPAKPPATENTQQNTAPAAPVSQPIDASKNQAVGAPSLPQSTAKPIPVSSPLIVQGPGYLAHQSGAQATANTTPQPAAPVNLTQSSAPRPEYMQAFQQAQLSQNAAIAANQRAANARAGIVMNGITPVRTQTNQLHTAPAAGYNRANTVAGNAAHQQMYARGAAQLAAQNQKRAYPTTPIRYAQNNARTASAMAAAAASLTPTQKYVRTPNGRAAANNYKNHLQAQDAATRFKAAYNNAGPALVNIVENAAAYFEGKDTPEAVKDKERSFERYLFNADLLSEIFDGPLPESNEDKNEGKTQSADPKKTPAQIALEKVLKVNLLEGIGGRMMNRSLEERVSELDALKDRFTRMENAHRKAEKGSMRLFQKVDRATSIDELRRVRAEYEKEMGVTFVEHPPLFEKRQLDKTISSISTPASEVIIVKLP